MRLNTDPRLPQNDDLRTLKTRLTEVFREVATQVNAVAEGTISGASNAATAAPVAGKYAVGDFVRNSAPVELGSAGSKYLVLGWTCVASPLTFVQTRALTGN